MDFESPDVEKDFPGLYASETGRKSNESDFSDGGDHEKPSKKDLLGRRKDKKEKKDRGYAALEGESSPEEDTDTKSPSKSKKTKSFKFPTKSKEKREKSRDKEKVLEDAVKHKELNEKEKKKEKEREKEKEKEKKEKEKKEKEKKDKIKEKDKEKEEKAKFKLESKEKLKDEKKDKLKEKEKIKEKEKDKDKIKEKDKDKIKEKDKEKIKDKDKDKKDKKLTKVPSTVTSGVPFEEIFTLGVALPIFGVPLQQSVERSRCHDATGLPLIVRDCIDYLQAHGIKSPQIYRAEADKIKLQQLRQLYTDRGTTFPYHWDVPVACAMLKSFISSLPESVLTVELHGQFEQAAALAEPARSSALLALLRRLPPPHAALLAWLARHFHCVLAHEQVNHANIQTIATAMGPALNMSLNLLTYLITKAEILFPDVTLTKYVPPLQSLPSDFPSTVAALSTELQKQESLLSQLHAEMHAGFTTKDRDQQLWEAQTILTQLKRKLRSIQKSVEPNSLPTQPSLDEKSDDEPVRRHSTSTEPSQSTVQSPPERKLPESKPSVESEDRTPISHDAFQDSSISPQTDVSFPVEFEDNFDFKPSDEFDSKHPDNFGFTAQDSFDFKPQDKFEFKQTDSFNFKQPDNFELKKSDNFEFKQTHTFDSKQPNNFDFKQSDSFDFQKQDSFDFKKPDNFDFKPQDSFEFQQPADFDFKQSDNFDFKPSEKFNIKPPDNFDFKPQEKFEFKPSESSKPSSDFEEPLSEPVKEKPKLSETELQILRLELENAEYLQLKSLLQAKINSEQFEIVKLRSHVALKNKQEANLQNKETRENTPEDEELKQRLIKENALLEQKRLSLINQIFQERVNCIQLKIDLAMKEILSKS